MRQSNIFLKYLLPGLQKETEKRFPHTADETTWNVFGGGGT